MNLSKAQKISKLANAIRRYRGRCINDLNGQFVKWVNPPNKNDIVAVQRWLHHLKQDVTACVEKINNFKTFKEFEIWLKTL